MRVLASCHVRRQTATPAARFFLFVCPEAERREPKWARYKRTDGGEGLTGEDMKRCRWLRPQLVAAIEFLERTADSHVRHPKFIRSSLRSVRIASPEKLCGSLEAEMPDSDSAKLEERLYFLRSHEREVWKAGLDNG